jgi:hypothetical protein
MGSFWSQRDPPAQGCAEEIAALEAEIEGYKDDLKKEGITPAEKSELRGLVNTTSQLLNLLLDEKAAATAGIRS